MLNHLDRLPARQRDALATVFGQSTGPAPDRFLAAVGTLSLFAGVAEQQPLGCIVDDAQRRDQASAQILGFVARRGVAGQVAVVCATRWASTMLAHRVPRVVHRGARRSRPHALLLDHMQGSARRRPSASRSTVVRAMPTECSATAQLRASGSPTTTVRND